MALATVIYAAISLYIVFTKTSLATNLLILFGLFIMVMYTLIPNATTMSWVLITVTLVVATIAFYGMFNIPIIGDIFNLAIVVGASFLVYKYIIKRFLNLHFTINPITIAVVAACVVIFWLYPKAQRKIEGEGKIILDEPVHLSSLRSIGEFNDGTKNTHNYHYSVSFWSFIHSQPGRNKYTPIFNYGAKPIVEYNQATQKIRVRVEKKTIYEGKITPQRWTNFVITYDRGIVDVFIDSKLVATESGIVPYMSYDIMTVGENNGISGGIGHVRYYDSPVSKATIDYNYKKFKMLNGKTFL
uniref:Lectin/glucanase superfamily protein n=1 Tax=viral metagenome TaxID=1070528 RepID=A0A6C0BTC4_9ZZZZ